MSRGLSHVRELYEQRGQRARELKAQGKRIMGYFCCYPPVEMMTALDLVPYRIQGSMREPITQADTYLETVMCPYMRSCFDQAIRGSYDFLDGLVVPHSCDTVQRIYDIWRFHKKLDYCHFLNIPHMLHSASYPFFEKEVERFQSSLEEFVGRKLDEANLRQAIKLHNRNRALLRELYELRKPPLLSGSEALEVLVAGMTIPVAEFNQLLQEVLAEIRARSPLPPRPRLLVYGSEMDDAVFLKMVEDCGAEVVMDDLCTGSRTFWHPVSEEGNPISALAERYLEKINCPRTYRLRRGNHQEDVANRYSYLLDFIRDFQVQGVIFYIIRYCDTYEFDVPDVRDLLEKAGIPVLHLEDDYTLFTEARLRTRIEAFLETMVFK